MERVKRLDRPRLPCPSSTKMPHPLNSSTDFLLGGVTLARSDAALLRAACDSHREKFVGETLACGSRNRLIPVFTIS